LLRLSSPTTGSIAHKLTILYLFLTKRYHFVMMGLAKNIVKTMTVLDLSDIMGILCEGQGKLIAFLLSQGQRNESIFLEQLIEQGAVKRSGAGRPRLGPKRVVGDKGYTGRRILRNLRRRGIHFTIPRPSNEPRRSPFSREIYRQRNIVERAIKRLKQWRSIATRYEKLAANYTVMITIACILLWL
jgi:transposase